MQQLAQIKLVFPFHVVVVENIACFSIEGKQSLEEERLNTQVKKGYLRVFPSGPAVKNPPCHAKDIGLIPDWGAKTPCAMELLNPCTATRDPGRGGATTELTGHYWRVCVPQ